jgi:hypothetical protein
MNDTGATEKINFVFSASLPTAAQQSAAAAGPPGLNWGGLRVIQIADDAVKVAAATTTNAPASLSTADLLNIYTGVYKTWGDVPSYSGPAPSANIIPLLPPSSSSVTKTFVADLTTQNGSAPTLAGFTTVEQNDPSAVNSPNAIVPFSAGRLSLWNNGYFHNPATAFPGSSTPLTAGIQLLGGYNSPIKDYVIFRQKDATAAAWQPGSTQNWANTLFIGTHPFVESGAGQADIAAAGVTPDYNDLGSTISAN